MITDVELRRLAEAVERTDPAHRNEFLDRLEAFGNVATPATVLALLNRIDAVRALHCEGGLVNFPDAGTDAGVVFQVTLCAGCSDGWPCPTIRALGGAE